MPYPSGHNRIARVLSKGRIADHIKKVLKVNVIERSHSAWASPVVIMPKKNGKARFFVEFRRLNNITRKDSYPLPRMEGFSRLLRRC